VGYVETTRGSAITFTILPFNRPDVSTVSIPRSLLNLAIKALQAEEEEGLVIGALSDLELDFSSTLTAEYYKQRL
jgi:hypothetical protein